MARDYTPYPTNEPDSISPSYFRPDVSANTFGAYLGKGLEKFGEGVEKTGEWWGNVQVDDQVNKTLKEGDERVRQHKTLQGQAALDDQNAAQRDLTAIVEKYGGQLSGWMRVNFDKQIRSYQARLWNGELQTHDIKQGHEVANDVFKGMQDEAEGRAVKFAGNWNSDEFKSAVDDVKHAAERHLDHFGVTNPEAREMAIRHARANVYAKALEAMQQTDPEAAFNKANEPEVKEALGSWYPELSQKFRHEADVRKRDREGNELFHGELNSPDLKNATPRPGWPQPHAPGRSIDDEWNAAHERRSEVSEAHKAANEARRKAGKPVLDYAAEENPNAPPAQRAISGALDQGGRSQIQAAAPAIRQIESGAPEGKYHKISDPSSDGDRAYGAYQVMGKNIGPWTERWYGRRLTTREFLHNQEAQDTVFEGEFGEYVTKYGSPEIAARVWFGGPGGATHLNRTDIYRRLTTGTYGTQFKQLYEENLGR